MTPTQAKKMIGDICSGKPFDIAEAIKALAEFAANAEQPKQQPTKTLDKPAATKAKAKT